MSLNILTGEKLSVQMAYYNIQKTAHFFIDFRDSALYQLGFFWGGAHCQYLLASQSNSNPWLGNSQTEWREYI